MEGVRRVVVEADGGSRGNPGPAAFGALLRDPGSGMVLVDTAETIGTASNNVAEYRGLIAGLELAAEHTPDAEVEVRMDSKLVVEQMAGRWKVKHPNMRPLALRARKLAPPGTRWTWVPRADNAAADQLVNAVLDRERPEGVRVVVAGEPGATPATGSGTSTGGPPGSSAATGTGSSKGVPLVGWRDRSVTVPTTVVLLRHGVTAHTEAKLFSGSSGSDPGLTEHGRSQARRAAGWLARRRTPAASGADAEITGPVGVDGVGPVDVILSSPLRRCRETAEIAAEALQLPVTVRSDLAEVDFGEWDGLTFDEVRAGWPDLLDSWLTDETACPPGGESSMAVAERTTRALADLVAEQHGRTVLVVSHMTPIKAAVRDILDASTHILHHMQLAPASLTIAEWWPDGWSVLRTFSFEPE